jgi:polyisoprenoid-binding protein YceI
MGPTFYDHALIEILGPAGLLVPFHKGYREIDLETDTVVSPDVVDLFSLPRRVKIDPAFVIGEVEGLDHGITVLPGSPQPAHMAGIQDAKDNVPVFDLLVALSHSDILKTITHLNGEVTMSTWIIDPDHSVAAFAVKHLKVAYVRGQFNSITGKITLDPDDPSRSSVEAEIAVASMTTGIRKRDEHLFTPDFFEASKYPTITFKSTKTEATGPNRGRVTGGLTIRGITRPVTMEVEYSGPVKSPFGGEITMGFSASTTINRFDYNVSWDVPMEDGGLIVDKDVKIMIDVEADLSE